MKTLNLEELDAVSGGNWVRDFGRWFGRNQDRIFAYIGKYGRRHQYNPMG